MSDQYRLVGLGNSELLAKLSELARQSNDLTAQLLAHLVELEQRMLHLELGFSSLFAYCVEALGMSEGTAGRRVTAARVCRRFPEAFERIARGELHLCALCALAPHLNEANAAELFEACIGKPRRHIEQLLAARFPRPDVREQIRRMPTPAQMRVDANSQAFLAPRELDALGDARSVKSRFRGRLFRRPSAWRQFPHHQACRLELSHALVRVVANSSPFPPCDSASTSRPTPSYAS